VGLELDLLPQVVSELQRIGEEVLVHRQERRGKRGRVAARQGMIVVGGGEDEHVLVVSLLDGTEKLIAALHLLQPDLGNTQRQVDDLALPNVDRPVQGPHHHFDLRATLRTEDVGRVEPYPRCQC